MEIFTIFLTTLLILSMFSLFLSTLKSKRSPMVALKLPPSPSKLHIIGNLHHLLGKPRHEALWQLSQKYGPIMQLHIGSKPYLVISSSALAKDIFKTQDHIFCSRPLSHSSKRLTYNYLDIVLSPYSNHWKKMRKLLVSEFLGPKRATLFNRILVSEVDDMVRSILSQPSNTVVNLNKWFFSIVKGTVCKVAFGKNYREEPLKGPSCEVMLDEILEILNGSLSDFFPFLGRLINQFSGWNYKLEKCFTNIDAYLEAIFDDHQINHEIGEVSDDDKDFLHSLLELSSVQHVVEDRLTKGEIKALIIDILTGGIDTTVVTMVWAMSEINRSPRVMQKLQSEIRNCVGRKQEVHEIDITKMSYLKWVVKETLRLHPPAPMLIPHENLTQCQIGGYDILPKTCVLVNGWAIGRDPNTWGENATEFYPERFENLDVDFGGGNFEMVPFGGGRRSCPAMKTAPTTIEYTIANLLCWFDWGVPNGVKNEDLNMLDEGSLLLRKKLPLCLVPKKHNWEANKAFSFGNPSVQTVVDRFLNKNLPTSLRTSQLIRQYQEKNIKQLNMRLTNLLAQLAAEKKTSEELIKIRKAKEFLWDASYMENLGVEELEKLVVALLELKKNAEKQAEKLKAEVGNISTTATLNLFSPGIQYGLLCLIG